jgi:hypothetical protein
MSSRNVVKILDSGQKNSASKAKGTIPDIVFETIIPEIASIYLAKTIKNNRKISDTHVQMLMDDLISGRWEVNSECIKFTTEGLLLDGQHRLQACARSGVPLPTFVARNVSKSAILSVDRGRKRSPGDVITFRGYANGFKLGATCRKLLMYAMNDHKRKFSMSILDEVVRENPGISASITFCNGDGFVPVSTLAAVHYIGSHIQGRASEADAFVGVIKSGVPVYKAE